MQVNNKALLLRRYPLIMMFLGGVGPFQFLLLAKIGSIFDGFRPSIAPYTCVVTGRNIEDAMAVYYISGHELHMLIHQPSQ